MNITTVVLSDDSVQLKLAGRLDTTTAPAALTAFTEAVGQYMSLVLDFTDLEYISSAGLRTLLSTQKAVTKKSGTMVLEHVTPAILEVFEMTGFSGILTIR